MKQRWYRTPQAKIILTVAAHVIAVMAGICFLWVTRYPILTQELFALDSAKKYENTDSFSRSVENANEEILSEIRYLHMYGSNGKYDPDKIVDVADYADNSQIS